MKQKQPILGNKGTLLFLVLISAFPPLTIDLYLPALPQMVEALNTDQGMVNLTLSIYFVTYAIGLLFWGPLSEKYGRKPILLTGMVIYILASLLCSLAGDVEHLIYSRVLQAFGGSAVTVVATAIVKDLYDGRERAKIMAIIMSLVIIAPMVAPILGAFLLKVSSWRMIFVALAVFGGISMLLTLCYRETLVSRYNGSVFRSWGRLIVVLQNPRFVSLLAIFSIVPMVIMSFLASGVYIYIDGFGLTEQEFSYAFAFNAFCAAFGPMTYIKLSKFIAVQKLISLFFLLMTICGVLTFSIGHVSPWLFAFFAAPATLAVIAIRIPGTNLMLDQQDTDIGSAVALIQFFAMIFGSLGMVLVSINPDTLIENLGVIQFVVGVTAGGLWLLVKNRPHVVNNIVKMAE